MPVRVNLKPLERFASSVQAALAQGGSNSPMRKAIRQWGVICRAWTLERFDKFSKGGGDWDKLKPSTIRGRRKGKGRKVKTTTGGKGKARNVAQGTVAILADTGTLKGALEPTIDRSSGALELFIENGIRVGYGGQARHESGDGTIAMIARVHQTGNPGKNLPARPIIVDPPESVVQDMADVTERALGLEWKRATG